jgi:hypothetical protein
MEQQGFQANDPLSEQDNQWVSDAFNVMSETIDASALLDALDQPSKHRKSNKGGKARKNKRKKGPSAVVMMQIAPQLVRCLCSLFTACILFTPLDEAGLLDSEALEDNIEAACTCHGIIEPILHAPLLRQKLWHHELSLMRSLLLNLAPTVAAGLTMGRLDNSSEIMPMPLDILDMVLQVWVRRVRAEEVHTQGKAVRQACEDFLPAATAIIASAVLAWEEQKEKEMAKVNIDEMLGEADQPALAPSPVELIKGQVWQLFETLAKATCSINGLYSALKARKLESSRAENEIVGGDLDGSGDDDDDDEEMSAAANCLSVYAAAGLLAAKHGTPAAGSSVNAVDASNSLGEMLLACAKECMLRSQPTPKHTPAAALNRRRQRGAAKDSPLPAIAPGAIHPPPPLAAACAFSLAHCYLTIPFDLEGDAIGLIAQVLLDCSLSWPFPGPPAAFASMAAAAAQEQLLLTQHVTELSGTNDHGLLFAEAAKLSRALSSHFFVSEPAVRLRVLERFTGAAERFHMRLARSPALSRAAMGGCGITPALMEQRRKEAEAEEAAPPGSPAADSTMGSSGGAGVPAGDAFSECMKMMLQAIVLSVVLFLQNALAVPELRELTGSASGINSLQRPPSQRPAPAELMLALRALVPLHYFSIRLVPSDVYREKLLLPLLLLLENSDTTVPSPPASSTTLDFFRRIPSFVDLASQQRSPLEQLLPPPSTAGSTGDGSDGTNRATDSAIVNQLLLRVELVPPGEVTSLERGMEDGVTNTADGEARSGATGAGISVAMAGTPIGAVSAIDTTSTPAVSRIEKIATHLGEGSGARGMASDMTGPNELDIAGGEGANDEWQEEVAFSLVFSYCMLADELMELQIDAIENNRLQVASREGLSSLAAFRYTVLPVLLDGLRVTPDSAPCISYLCHRAVWQFVINEHGDWLRLREWGRIWTESVPQLVTVGDGGMDEMNEVLMDSMDANEPPVHVQLIPMYVKRALALFPRATSERDVRVALGVLVELLEQVYMLPVVWCVCVRSAHCVLFVLVHRGRSG